MVEIVNIKNCNDWGKPGDVLINRTTKWGNPFIMHNEVQRDMVCDQYELWLNKKLLHKELNLDDLSTAKRLGCHCKPKRCHGDYLKKLLDEKQKTVQQSLNL